MHPIKLRVWAISGKTPGSATKGSANVSQGEEPSQQLTAHLHMLSLRIVSMRSPELLKFSKVIQQNSPRMALAREDMTWNEST